MTDQTRGLRRRAVTATLLAAPFILRAVSAQAATLIDRPTPLPSPVKLVVGAAKVAHLSPVAMIAGDLKALGVEMEVVNFVRYADARTALAAGSLDIASVGPADVPIAMSQGITNLVALMGVGSQPKYPVVRKGLTLDRWSDLEGKKIAVASASAVWFQFVASLQEHGVAYNKLQAVNIQGAGSNFDDALKRGEVDALITWEPFESVPLAEGYGTWATNLDYSTSKAVGAELGMFAATQSAVTAKREAVRRFIWAYVNAQNALAASPEKFAEAIAAYTGISIDISRRISVNTKLGAVLSLQQMQRQAKAFNELGVITRDVSAELPAHFAGDLVDSVLKA